MLPHPASLGEFLFLATKRVMQHTDTVICPLLVPPFPSEFLQEVETLSGYPGVLETSYPDLLHCPVKIHQALKFSNCPCIFKGRSL